MSSDVRPRRFVLRKAGRWSRTHVLATGNPPVGQAAVLHRGRLWQPDTADVPGDTWEFRRNGFLGLWRLSTTIVSRRTGAPIAHHRFWTLDIVGGPTLRYHPRGFRPEPPRYVRSDGVVVATLPRRNVVDVMSGHPHVDLVCALASLCRQFGTSDTTRLPPSGV